MPVPNVCSAFARTDTEADELAEADTEADIDGVRERDGCLLRVRVRVRVRVGEADRVTLALGASIPTPTEEALALADGDCDALADWLDDTVGAHPTFSAPSRTPGKLPMFVQEPLTAAAAAAPSAL